VVKRYCSVNVRVVGHTDSMGSEADNKALSERRAASVQAYMQSQGLDRGQLTIEGRGESSPIASNADENGRQQNRRVEIFLRPPAG
jgi:outer membrane protein OmpA-like peptidoglycan-associated protein